MSATCGKAANAWRRAKAYVDTRKPHYTTDNFRFEGSIAHALRSAASHIDLEFGRLFSHWQLTYQQWAILMALRAKLTTTATDLSRSNCYDAGSLSRLIDVLVRRNLIARERSGDDRRIVLLHLTHRGEDLLKQLLPKVVATWNVLLNGFEGAEINALARLLERLAPSRPTRSAGCISRPSLFHVRSVRECPLRVKNCQAQRKPGF